MTTAALGDRMKGYECVTTQIKIDPIQPFIVRVDGRSFSKKTRKLTIPFDENFSNIMVETSKDLLKEFSPDTVITHSDEISLFFYPRDTDGFQPLFNGKIQKIVSVISSYTSVRFNFHLSQVKDINLENGTCHFDGRVFNVPNNVEMCNYFLWRMSRDCIRNSVSSLARSMMSAKDMHKKNTGDLKDMIKEQGNDWDKLPELFKYGCVVKRMYYLGPNDSIRTKIFTESKHIDKFTEEFTKYLSIKSISLK